METHVADIAHAIQMAVAPVFLLTAIATLMNVLNARLSRSIDRRRALEQMMKQSQEPAELAALRTEHGLHRERLRVIYFGIFASVLAALLICLVVVGAFVGALIAVEVSRIVAVLFIAAMIAMILSLVFFLYEVFLMLK
ncbi:MAG: DUF2721 domain-containing protein [Formosimonas sp.]